MSDLIDRQAALEAVIPLQTYKMSESDDMLLVNRADVQTELMMLPSAQPERKMGRWLTTDAYPHNVYCSQCYKTFAQTHWAVWEDGTLPRNFCPNCGADMREVSE